MVSDVRQKLGMRFAALLERLMTEIRRSPELQNRIKAAQVEPLIAIDMKRHYRSEFCREFPGCTITFGRESITIHLPESYPTARIPFVGICPPALIECLRPRGLSNTPF